MEKRLCHNQLPLITQLNIEMVSVNLGSSAHKYEYFVPHTISRPKIKLHPVSLINQFLSLKQRDNYLMLKTIMKKKTHLHDSHAPCLPPESPLRDADDNPIQTTRTKHALHRKNLTSLHWRHNGRGSVSNHQPHDCLLSRLFRRRSKKTSKVRVTGLCAGNSPGTGGEFPAQMASNAENVSIWWRHHVKRKITAIPAQTNIK